jgi:hypothetical protein
MKGREFNVPPEYRSAHDFQDRRIEEVEEELKALRDWQGKAIPAIEEMSLTLRELTKALVGDQYGNPGLVAEMRKARERYEEWDKWKWYGAGAVGMVLLGWELFKQFA